MEQLRRGIWPVGEAFNGVTHLIGAVFALVGAILLIVRGALVGDAWQVVSFSIYGALLVSLYIASTLYHAMLGRAKRIWRKFDHCSIYLLIAGSYTPFALVTLRGAWGWSLFGVIWGLAIFGIVQELCLAKGMRLLSLVLYAVMGWLALLAYYPLIEILGWEGFSWLLGGGLVYTAGIFFYAIDERWPPGHGIWHLFVIGGSLCHYIALYVYVSG